MNERLPWLCPLNIRDMTTSYVDDNTIEKSKRFHIISPLQK